MLGITKVGKMIIQILFEAGLIGLASSFAYSFLPKPLKFILKGIGKITCEIIEKMIKDVYSMYINGKDEEFKELEFIVPVEEDTKDEVVKDKTNTTKKSNTKKSSPKAKVTPIKKAK